MTAYKPECAVSRSSHLYGSGRRCLHCGHLVPRPGPRTVLDTDVEEALRARPTVPDIAGWPEEDPWT